MPSVIGKKLARGIWSGSGPADLFEHAGAAAAAVDCGWTFVAADGISGGGIIASAVATGIQPGEELNRLLLEFMPVEKKVLDRIWFTTKLSHFGRARGAKFTKLLASRLPKRTFGEAKIPLRVWTNVLNTAEGHEWSTAKTPGESIAERVADGCRHPAIFVPKRIKGKEHDDGGVYHNFPVDATAKECAPGEVVLGFYFPHTPMRVKEGDPVDEIAAIVSTMMASRTKEDIEDAKALGPHVHVIALPPGAGLDTNVTADEAKKLIEKGYEATRKYLDALPKS